MSKSSSFVKVLKLRNMRTLVCIYIFYYFLGGIITCFYYKLFLLLWRMKECSAALRTERIFTC